MRATRKEYPNPQRFEVYEKPFKKEPAAGTNIKQVKSKNPIFRAINLFFFINKRNTQSRDGAAKHK